VKRILTWAIAVPAAILLVGFAVANRNWVDISFDPFDRDNPAIYLRLPLWGVLTLGIFIGILAGWINAWLGQRRWRRHARALRRENDRLQAENVRLEAERDPPRPAATSTQDTGLLGTF
jgi:hypothetical protein